MSCNGEKLLKHPRRALLDKCGVADGIRLFNLLRVYKEREDDSENLIPRQKYSSQGYSFSYENSDSESEDSEATLSNEYESDDDFSCEKFRIRKPSVNINIDNLNINRMRSALADLVGSDENQIDRIFLEKTVENGEEIKVIITDEYLKNVALSEKVHV